MDCLLGGVSNNGTVAGLSAGPRCREFPAGPVMAMSAVDGHLVIAAGNRVETHAWRGGRLQRTAFYDAQARPAARRGSGASSLPLHAARPHTIAERARAARSVLCRSIGRAEAGSRQPPPLHALRGGGARGAGAVTHAGAARRTRASVAQVLVTSLAVVKSYILAGDVHQGLTFLRCSDRATKLEELSRVGRAAAAPAALSFCRINRVCQPVMMAWVRRADAWLDT